jgi:hypothetical protein
VNAIVLFWVTSPTSNLILTHAGPQPTHATSVGIGYDGHQAGSPLPPGRLPPSPVPNRRSSTALVLSSAPHSLITSSTPNLQEKNLDSGFLSPSAWKNRFSVSLSNVSNNKPVEPSFDRNDRHMGMGSRAPSPRREVWDDGSSRPTSLVIANDIEASRSGLGYVTIGAPPPSKKRNAGRSRAVDNSVETSQRSGSRNPIFGRIFGSTDEREKDMEVTVTVTTQLDHMGDLEGGLRRSIGETSTAGGSANVKTDGDDGHMRTENLNLFKP